MIRHTMYDDVDLPASTYNEIRKLHHDFFRAYFENGSRRKILCDKCGKPLSPTPHYDLGSTYPLRQALCSDPSCGFLHYVVA